MDRAESQSEVQDAPSANANEMEAATSDKASPEADTPQISIPLAPDSLSSGFIGPVITVVLQGVIAAVLAVFSTVDVFFDQREYVNGALLASTHAFYLTGTTVVASLISIWTTGQIRRLWVAKKYSTLDREDEPPAALRRQFSVLVGLGSLKAQVVHGNLTVSLAIAGLLTTAIVSGLAPSVILVKDSFEVDIHPTRNMTADTCFTKRTDVSSVSSEWFSWQTSDGNLSIQGGTYATGQNYFKYGFDKAEVRRCETSWVPPTLSNFRYTPVGFAYNFGGIAVGVSASGMPYAVEAATFARSWNLNGGLNFFESTDSATSCLPVLTGNPATCRIETESKSLILKDAQRIISATGNNCTIESPPLQVDPARLPGAMVAGACTSGHAVGTATIVLGATSEYGKTLTWLAARPGEYDSYDKYSTRTVVTCDVDVRALVAFRQVTLRRSTTDDLINDLEEKPRLVVVADKDRVCTPKARDGSVVKVSDIMTATALATAASASWPLLAENRLLDGYLDTMVRLAANTYSSRTQRLEDILGMASGVALGMYWSRASADAPNPVWVTGGEQMRIRIKVGPGKLWALVFCVPPLFAGFLILYLLWTGRQ